MLPNALFGTTLWKQLPVFLPRAVTMRISVSRLPNSNTPCNAHNWPRKRVPMTKPSWRLSCTTLATCCRPNVAGGYMDGYGTIDHEKLGADYLREQGFSEKVAQLIENHVNAKRYLVFKNPNYFARLSEASLKTLEFQGGPMTAIEAMAFETNPYFKGILQMRTWDEQAKIPGLPTPDMHPLYGNWERMQRLNQRIPKYIFTQLSESIMNHRLYLSLCFYSPLPSLPTDATAQKTYTTLQVPGRAEFCQIDADGKSVLPSGRYVTPAGQTIRIANDPFGLAISPNGQRAVSLHDGVLTV